MNIGLTFFCALGIKTAKHNYGQPITCILFIPVRFLASAYRIMHHVVALYRRKLYRRSPTHKVKRAEKF